MKRRQRRMAPSLLLSLLFTSSALIVLFQAHPASCLPISSSFSPPEEATISSEPESRNNNLFRHSINTQIRSVTASTTSTKPPPPPAAEEEEEENTAITYIDSSALQTEEMEESLPPSIVFPRHLLDFNVTLIGTNSQFQNGNSDDAETLEMTREILETFLLEGYLNMTAPVLNLTLQQVDRYQLFPGSLIHTFSYSGTLFVWQLESNWNTYKVQEQQENLLVEREADVEQLLRYQGIDLLVNGISVTAFDPNHHIPKDTADDENTIPMETLSPRIKTKTDTSTTNTYLAITVPVAFLAFLAFVFFVKKKSNAIQVQRQSELERRKKQIAEDGDEELADEEDEDTGSEEHSMPSK